MTAAEPLGAAGSGGEDVVFALGREVGRAVRKVDRLDGQVAQLAELVIAMGERLHANAGPAPAVGGRDGEDAGPPGLRSWLLADDPELAADALDDLALWVWRVYLWYPDAALSSCWLWHPEVVEELWCLRLAHADAYDARTGTVLRMGDWHDRQRPSVARRVRIVLGKCELSRHADRNGRGIDITPPGPPALARHTATVATVWAAGAGLDAVRAAGPEPTEEQLAEAEAYQRTLYRSHR